MTVDTLTTQIKRFFISVLGTTLTSVIVVVKRRGGGGVVRGGEG